MRIQEAKEILRDAGYSFEKSVLREAREGDRENCRVVALQLAEIIQELEDIIETCSDDKVIAFLYEGLERVEYAEKVAKKRAA